jgi:rod shape-determining protein MreC
MVAGFLFISIVLILLDRRSLLDPIRDGLGEVFEPIQSGFSRVVDRTGSQSDLEKDLAAVTAERDALQAENANLKAQQAELETLREQQKVQDEHPDWQYISARVIGSDPTGAQHFAIINRGSADGLAKGMAVVDPNYYVGQIVEVEEHRSKVMFIIDTSMRVGAKLSDTRSDGVIYGRWNLGGRLLLGNLDKNYIPKANEWVVTADDSSVQTRQVPPNIPIGVVIGEPTVNKQTDELEVEVRPAVPNFDDLQVVWVVSANAKP